MRIIQRVRLAQQRTEQKNNRAAQDSELYILSQNKEMTYKSEQIKKDCPILKENDVVVCTTFEDTIVVNKILTQQGYAHVQKTVMQFTIV